MEIRKEMSTLEHLFMQISERKDWIEDQLRHQAESYGQTVAYNLVADGRRPPPWLWASEPGDAASRPDLKELNREQIISEILFPLPRTTTSLAKQNTFFMMPTLKDDHVIHSDSFFTETCALNKVFKAEQKNKAVANIYHNGSEQNSDMMVEPEVIEACGEFDRFAGVQHSKSRQRDLEICLSKKAKTTNHLIEESIVDMNSGGMTRSRVASAKADCVRKSSNSLLHNEDGDGVIQSRFTAQKLYFLEKSVKSASPLHLVKDVSNKAMETEMNCRPMPHLNVDNHAFNIMDATTLGKDGVSDEACPVNSSPEVRLNKKAKSTRSLGDERTMGGNSCRMTSSVVASVKVDCVKKSSDLLLFQNENGDRVTRSRFTTEKFDCLEKALKPAKLLDLIEDAAQRVIETEMNCSSMLPFNADNLALSNMEDVAPHRLATGTSGKVLVSDAVQPFQLALKMTRIAVPENSVTLPLVKPNKLVFDGMEECGLNHKSSFTLEKDDPCFSPEIVLTDMEVVESVKEGSCGDFQKLIGPIGSRQLQEVDALHTSQSICRTEEFDQNSSRGMGKETVGSGKIENCEYHSQPTLSSKFFSIPSSATCTSENASTHSSLMRDSTSNSNESAKQHFCRRTSSARLVKYTMEECSGKLMKELTSVVACGPLENNSLVKPKHDNFNKPDLNKKSIASLEKDPGGSYSEINPTNLERLQSRKELSCRDSVTVYISPENVQLQVEDEKVSDGGGKEDRLELPETIESECYSHYSSRIRKPSQPPDISSSKVISGSSDTNKKHSLGGSLQCTIEQKYTENLIKESYNNPVQLINNLHKDTSVLVSPEAIEVHLEAEETDVAPVEVKKKSISQPTTPDGSETQNAGLEFQRLLRNSTTNNKILGSCGSNGSALPLNEAAKCFSAPGTVVNSSTRDVAENFVVWKMQNTAKISSDIPKSHYFLRSSRSPGVKGVAEKSPIRITLTPNNLETHNARPKTRYFLRSLTGQEKMVAFAKGIEHNEASSPTHSADTIARVHGNSWPKGKKIVGRSNNIHTTSSRVRLKQLLNILDDIDCKYGKTSENANCGCSKMSENGYGTAIELQPFHQLKETISDISNVASKSPLEMLQQSEERYLIEGGFFMKGKDQAVAIPSPIKNAQGELFSELARGNYGGCLEDEMKATEWDTTQYSCIDTADYLHGENTVECAVPDSSCCYEESTKEIEMCKEKSFHTDYVADDYLVGCDKTMPEYEGFSIGVSSTMEGEIFFDDSELPSIIRERASMLEQLGRSRSILTPGSRTSTKYKIFEVPDVYQSLPAGLLEHANLNNSFSFNDAEMKPFRASEDGRLSGLHYNLGSEFDGSFAKRLYLHSMHSSRTRSEWESWKPPLTPPIEKFCQRMISERGGASSEKVGSNPELTCFRIDENTSTIDENGYIDEIGASEEMVGSRGIKDSTSRKALVDVSASYQNSPNLVSLSKKFLERGTRESTNRESYFGTQMGVDSSLGKGYLSKIKSDVDEKEKHALSFSGKTVRRAGYSLRDRSSKPGISGKANESRSRVNQVKGCKPNNIASNISSFVPLMRQKQEAAAPMKGKKEIKVKALEAAEAAKRLEEKKQHERDLRKAAAKLERARLEQENARRLELKQKKKEEEKSKKEAGIAARKRQREEEERKEKERKRRCTEETRKHHREQEEISRTEKGEKELRWKAAGERERGKKDKGEAAKWQLKSEKGVTACRNATEEEPNTTKIVPENAIHSSDRLEAHGPPIISNDTKMAVRDSDSLQETIQDGISMTKEYPDLGSYDMSPFIDSDNEDGEEENRRKIKWIPLWARREYLDQIILSKKDLDPSAIFSHKRSFNLNEVLLPRIRRQPL